MLFDIYMIVITAFAVFGMFCLVEAIITSFRFSSAPKSVTVMLYNTDFSTYDTVRYIHNTLFNNEIILLADNTENRCPLAETVTESELHKYITNVLFTKN